MTQILAHGGGRAAGLFRGYEGGMSDDDPRPSEHDDAADEPLGPATPDDQTDLGDTPEAHDEISPHDLPPDHPGRPAAEEKAREDGTLEG